MRPYQFNKAIVTFTVALFLFSVTVCAQFSQARLQATGLTCALCSKAIHEALVQLPFVDSVRADIKSSAFDIRFRPDAVASLTTIRQSVEEAGFYIGAINLKLLPAYVDSVRSSRSFSKPTQSYRMLEDWKEGSSLQVVGRGYMTEKEFKKLAARYAGQMAGDQATFFLLPKSQ